MNDEDLMSAFASGDRTAFDPLFERFRDPVFTYLLHHAGHRSVAEDLFQEVFLRVVRQRASFEGHTNLSAWIFTIARNVSIDHHRRAATRRETPELAPGGYEALSCSGPEPDRQLESSQLGHRILVALSRLPNAQREVFLLRERAGLEFQAIAEMTGEKLATVKSRMRYALSALREQLESDSKLHLGGRHDQV